MFERLVRHGTLVAVAVLIVSVLGVVAALRIPVQMIPDLEVRTITVRTTWPGATPQDIEQEILIEQEEYLRNLPSLQRITSTASSGEAEIELEFPFGVDVTETLIRVNNALSQVPSYPQNVDQPRIYAASFSSNSFMYFRIAPLPGNPRQLDMDMMRDFVEDHVRVRMETVPGVSQVQVRGGAERQVRVLLDPVRLAERGLGVTDVRDALRRRNRDVSGGEIESGKRRFLLRTIGRFERVEDLEQLVLARRGDGVIRLGQVADVELDHFELRDFSTVNGAPVISLSVRRELGSNVLAIKDAMMAEVEAINREVLRPAGMELALTADDVTYVRASIRNVWKNLAIGACLATAVMFLFLRSVRATAVGVVGIPICTIAAFLGLLVAGRTVNVISLAGVAFAIGMTLDNSIVVLESIELERRRGLDRFRAAVAGVRQVWPAVLASTLTTILVFVPIVFIREEAGQLYSDIAIAVSASILVSMLIAITVIPTAAARLSFDVPGEGAGAEEGARDGLRGRVLRGIAWLTATPLRRTGCILGTVAASVGILVGLTPPAEYLPEGEEPKTFATLSAPPGYNLEAMSQVAADVERYFLPFLDDPPEAWERGETEVPALRYLNLWVDAQRLRIITEPKDPAHILDLMDAIAAKYAEYAGMRAFVTRGSIITSNDAGTRSVDLDVSGPRLGAVYEVARAAYGRAQEVFDDPRIQAEPSTLSLAQPLIEVRPDWERAAELGMSAEELGLTVAALTDGAYADEFFLGDDKVDIFLYSRAGTGATVDDLSSLLLFTPRGAAVPLSSLASVVETVDTSTVRRVNGRRTVTLNVIPPRDVALETGVGVVREDVVGALRAEGRIPADVATDISGASDQLDATREALAGNYVVALVIVYLLLVAIFGHWGHPLLIMTTIPLGIAGGIAGLWLLNAVGALMPRLGLAEVRQPFDMISMLGFLILMGTVVNNPILIVHRALTSVRDGQVDAAAAVREAVESRLRPIAMSTVTTVFGLAGTAVVTLTFLPALTVTVLRVLAWRRSSRRREESGPAAARTA
ncbi:MAG: efflux RND transporter permease subunit [Myxococcota bacterium]|nr:efflux RND transporter permease subunit [Myxococcota bacterium]